MRLFIGIKETPFLLKALADAIANAKTDVARDTYTNIYNRARLCAELQDNERKAKKANLNTIYGTIFSESEETE